LALAAYLLVVNGIADAIRHGRIEPAAAERIVARATVLADEAGSAPTGALIELAGVFIGRAAASRMH